MTRPRRELPAAWRAGRSLRAHLFVLLTVALAAPLFSVRAQEERPFPYRTGRIDALLLPAGTALVWAGSTLTGGPTPLTAPAVHALGPEGVPTLDRFATHLWSPEWSRASDGALATLLVGSLVHSFAPPALEGRWTEGVVLGTMVTEAGLLVLGVTQVTKGLVPRHRPWVRGTVLLPEARWQEIEARGNEASESFFSGHTAGAFTLAALTWAIERDLHGPSPRSRIIARAGFGVAAAVGAARIRAGEHYPSDVIVGAVVGTGIGLLVPALHRHGPPDAPGGGISLRVAPTGIAVRIPSR